MKNQMSHLGCSLSLTCQTADGIFATEDEIQLENDVVDTVHLYYGL